MRRFGHLAACFLAISLCAAVARADPTTARADVNLLAMGDWGTNGAEQRLIAHTMAARPAPRASRCLATLMPAAPRALTGPAPLLNFSTRWVDDLHPAGCLRWLPCPPP